ncbi:MAG: hypothetical protein ACYTAO_15635 [Planctomycetota bacterium]|jgi:hypothetical protein
MNLTDLEKDVLLRFFKNEQIDPKALIVSLDEIEVLDRTVAGSGVMIDLERHWCLRVGDGSQNYKYPDIGGSLNQERIPVGFLLYIERGFIEAIEGFTFGEVWPEKIVCYDLGGLPKQGD